MPLHGRNNQTITANSISTAANTSGAPLYTNVLVKGGGKVGTVSGSNSKSTNTSANGRVGVASGMWENTTVGVFYPLEADAIFGVTPGSQIQNRATGRKINHAGWNQLTVFSGPVVSATVLTNSGTFKNGESISVTNGSIATSGFVGSPNATLIITTNSSGNAVSLAVGAPFNGGNGFTNSTNIVLAYDRQKWVTTVALSAGNAYNNSDYLVVSNGAALSVPAKITFSTNTAGGFTGGTLTVANSGLYGNNIGAGGANLVLAVVNSTGGTTTAGNNLTSGFTVTLANSSGTLTANVILGGRAGRVQYECLVAMGSLGAQSSAVAAVNSTVQFANTAQEYLWIPDPKAGSGNSSSPW